MSDGSYESEAALAEGGDETFMGSGQAYVPSQSSSYNESSFSALSTMFWRPSGSLWRGGRSSAIAAPVALAFETTSLLVLSGPAMMLCI